MAVLAADAVGYSKQIELDQARTVQALIECRSIMADAIVRHSGRVIGTPGDFFLAEFLSAVDAVYCADELRSLLFDRNAKVPSADRIKYRIGVALGDVLDDGSDIHGTAVNTAARLQAIAKPDQVLVSSTLHDIVRSRADLAFSYVGERKLKNIRNPVKVYKLLGRSVQRTESLYSNQQISGMEGLSESKIKHPKKPIIEIEKFKTLSGEAIGDFFGMALAEELVTTISRISSAVEVKPPSLGDLQKYRREDSFQNSETEELNYRIGGSVRIKEGSVRITARLVELVNGITLWADRYEYEMSDSFDVQEIIAREVITALQVVLTEGEQAFVWDSKTTNIRAWELFHRGHDLERQYRRETHVEARRCYERALESDPDFVPAIVSLGFCYLDEIRLGWAEELEQMLAKAEACHERAAAIDPDFGDCHALLAFVNLLRRRENDALREMNIAVTLEPHSAEMTAYLGALYDHTGKFSEAIAAYQRAMELSRFCPPWIPANLGLTYCVAGYLDDAREAFESVIETFPKYVRAHIGLCVVYVRLGEEIQAQRSARQVLLLDPHFTADEWASEKPFSAPELTSAFVRDLRIAGIP